MDPYISGCTDLIEISRSKEPRYVELFIQFVNFCFSDTSKKEVVFTNVTFDQYQVSSVLNHMILQYSVFRRSIFKSMY